MNNYRNEIDSLRGISILLVILFHCKIDFFKWGYIGVDIFFVISGFLITKIIQNNIYKKNFFYIFLENRIRRIIPVLFFCLLINLIIYYYLFDPIYILTLSKIILSVLLNIQNYYFMFLNDYFDIASDKNIFLHTWSLAVELQFYFIIFFLLYFFSLLKKKNKILFAILIIFSLSFLASNNVLFSSEFIFYSTITRFWELSAGSIVALINLKKINNTFKYKYFLEVALIIILILLIYFFFYENIVFKSYVILLPVIATSIILLFIKKNTFIFYLLNFKPLRFLGLISFSLYIWHYNIFAIGRNLKVKELSLPDYLILTIVSVIISIISYLLIEKPFRNKKLINIKNFTTILIIKFAIILFFIFKNFYDEGYVFRNKVLTNANLPKNYFLNSQINYFENKNQTKNCLKNVDGICNVNSSKDSLNKILFIGDSTMLDFVQPFDKFSKKNNIDSSILYKPGEIFTKKTKDNSQQKTIDFILNNNFDIYIFVILFPDSEFLVELFEKISEKNKKIVFFIPRPILNYNPIKVMMLDELEILKAQDSHYNNNNIYWRDLLSKKILHNNYLIFDQFQAILDLSCGSTQCFNGHINKEIPIYRDEAHLTSIGSSIIFNNFLERNIKFLMK
jgi:hypothetical protein